jgi:hypothetical protein
MGEGANMSHGQNIAVSRTADRKRLLLIIGVFIALIAWGVLKGDYGETLINGSSF